MDVDIANRACSSVVAIFSVCAIWAIHNQACLVPSTAIVQAELIGDVPTARPRVHSSAEISLWKVKEGLLRIRIQAYVLLTALEVILVVQDAAKMPWVSVRQPYLR